MPLELVLQQMSFIWYAVTSQQLLQPRRQMLQPRTPSLLLGTLHQVMEGLQSPAIVFISMISLLETGPWLTRVKAIQHAKFTLSRVLPLGKSTASKLVHGTGLASARTAARLCSLLLIFLRPHRSLNWLVRRLHRSHSHGCRHPKMVVKASSLTRYSGSFRISPRVPGHSPPVMVVV